ncbi:MAG: hypothetical protein HKL85_04950 [Acidimicrobiaceae bacterium]|nr:hypothetical protein [Acidimicrobiaceae bacterium]
MLVVQITGAAVLVFLITAFFFRGRVAGRRDGAPKKIKSRADFHPSLPPSPYQPSRGFRILDGEEPVSTPPVRLPRLDPNKEFVFNETQVTIGDSISPPQFRHDEKWALDRSMRHAPHLHVRRRRRMAGVIVVIVVIVVLVVVVALAAVLALHHSPTSGLHNSGLSLVTVVNLV